MPPLIVSSDAVRLATVPPIAMPENLSSGAYLETNSAAHSLAIVPPE